jgi:exportin-2 (importin alpha re-exporter)
MLLEMMQSAQLPPDFKPWIEVALTPTPWDTRGNVPPLARFVSAIIPKAAPEILAEGKLEAILSIFQRLLSGKKTEQNAFDVLEAVVGSFQG